MQYYHYSCRYHFQLHCHHQYHHHSHSHHHNHSLTINITYFLYHHITATLIILLKQLYKVHVYAKANS